MSLAGSGRGDGGRPVRASMRIYSQGIDVGSSADLLDVPGGLLGRHVARATEQLARCRARGVLVQEFCEAEVTHFRRPIRRHEDVAGLQVAMDDSRPMDSIDGEGERRDQLGGLAGR